MSSKNPPRPCVTVRQNALLTLVAALVAVVSPLRSVADQTISTDATLTEDVSGKLTVENGASVRIAESLTVGSYAINSGTLTIAAGKTFKAIDTASNYLGVDAANESSYSHTGNIGAIVLEDYAVMEDKSNHDVHLFTSRLGSEARIVVGSGARFDMDWKYIKANGNTSNSNRNGNVRVCPAGTAVKCSGTGSPVFEVALWPSRSNQRRKRSAVTFRPIHVESAT